MNNSDIVVVVVLLIGAVVSIVLELWMPVPDHPRQVSTLVAGIFLDIAAFVPQIIENATVTGATNDISALFLILITLSIYMKFPAERNLILQARTSGRNVAIVTIQSASMFVPITFFVIWQYQCGYLSDNEGRQKLLKGTAYLFTIASLVLMYWVFRPKPTLSFVDTAGLL
jgi:hypothetical protein